MPLSVRAWTLEEGKTKIFSQEPFKRVYKIVLAIGLKICPRQAWKSLTNVTKRIIVKMRVIIAVINPKPNKEPKENTISNVINLAA